LKKGMQVGELNKPDVEDKLNDLNESEEKVAGGAAGNGSMPGEASNGAGADAKKSVEDAKKANQINPQPEPPAPAGKGEDAKKSVEQAKQANQLNPQPEPPAPQKGILESIVEFFASLFGWK